MAKEHIIVDINPNIPEPYLSYIRERNGQIGRDIALIQGLPFSGFTNENKHDTNAYLVASKTFSFKDAMQHGIKDPQDFYGAITKSQAMIGKTILYPTTADHPPTFYNPNFAQKIQEDVLLGISAFSKEEVIRKYIQEKNGRYDYRLKQPNESDGDGQYPVKSKEELIEVLSEVRISHEGLVLEPNLHHTKTISVGTVQIGQEKFSFIANQKNEAVSEKGASRYLGAFVKVAKGGFNQLHRFQDLTEEEYGAIQKVGHFHQAYVTDYHVIASRISYDVLFGYDNYGNQLSGITDITGRVGGTCPAIMQSAIRFKANPSLNTTFAEVTLNYHPDQSLPEEKDSTLYINQPTLRLSAKVY